MWFPAFFLGMWLGVGGLLSMMSGWVQLARRFPGGPRPTGERLRGQVTRVGIVNENGVTGLVVTSRGLYLYSNPLFRFLRPPVMVPWSQVRYEGERGRLWWHAHVLRLGDATSVRIKQRAYETLHSFLSQPIGAPAA
jgi:hypothetical protein